MVQTWCCFAWDFIFGALGWAQLQLGERVKYNIFIWCFKYSIIIHRLNATRIARCSAMDAWVPTMARRTTSNAKMCPKWTNMVFTRCPSAPPRTKSPLCQDCPRVPRVGPLNSPDVSDGPERVWVLNLKGRSLDLGGLRFEARSEVEVLSWTWKCWGVKPDPC